MTHCEYCDLCGGIWTKVSFRSLRDQQGPDSASGSFNWTPTQSRHSLKNEDEEWSLWMGTAFLFFNVENKTSCSI